MPGMISFKYKLEQINKQGINSEEPFRKKKIHGIDVKIFLDICVAWYQEYHNSNTTKHVTQERRKKQALRFLSLKPRGLVPCVLTEDLDSIMFRRGKTVLKLYLKLLSYISFSYLIL